MCTLVILKRSNHNWPLLISANRDEMKSRRWEPPARHWHDRPYTVAGLDLFAQGSWLGMNDFGVFAAILNRHGSLGPDLEKRSRGELVLEALDFSEATEAANAMKDLNSNAYKSFNLIVGDNKNLYWIANSNTRENISVEPIPNGPHMITGYDLNDERSERIKYYLPLFKRADVPEPDLEDWKAWRTLLASQELGRSEDSASAMCIERGNNYGTVSSSLIALASPEMRQKKSQPDQWQFAPGPPNRTEYKQIKF